MLPAASRFTLGFTACAVLSLALFFVARSWLLTTVQTPESEPHYEVRYAGISSEAMLAVVVFLPLVVGSLFAIFNRRTISKRVAIASVVLVLPVGFGLILAFKTVVGDALWLGMD